MPTTSPAKKLGPVVRIYGSPAGSTKKTFPFFVQLGRSKATRSTGKNLERLMSPSSARTSEAQIAELPER